MKLKELLREKLSEEELKLVPRSFDIIGSREKAVAIVEIPEELKNKDKLIAEAIMELNKNVKTVLKKLSGRKGKFRLYKFRLITGEKDTEVVHKEHGCLIKVDPRKAYFSPRELTERQRIAKQVKPNEKVLIMFSGVMPYGIVMAKKQPKVEKIYGVEINPKAHGYALENVRVNKLSDKIILIKGDVKKVCPKFLKFFDRVVMPYAIEGWKYLDLAINCLKRNGILHFYYISPEKKLFEDAIEVLEKNAKKLKRKVKVLSKRKVGRFGVRLYKICLDAEIK